MYTISFDLLLLLLCSGAMAGILAGLFGIGGGLLLVPVVAMTAAKTGLDTAVSMQIAVATAMASILLTAIGSVLAHHRRAAIHWHFLSRYAPLVMVGAWSGALVVEHIAGLLDGRLLVYVFVGFALLSAWQLLAQKKPKHEDAAVAFHFRWQLDLPVGLLVGHLSAWLGIGGGSMNAPYFHFRGLPMRHAVGTAAACGYPLALAAVIGFTMHDLDGGDWPLIGAIFWPAALLMGSMGLLSAPLGAKMAHSLPERLLKALFAVLLLALAGRLLWL